MAAGWLPLSSGEPVPPRPVAPGCRTPKPVLEPGPDGAWDGIRVGEPSVVVTEEGLLMYYTGSGRADRSDRLGLATSSDGVTKFDHPSTTGPAFAESDPGRHELWVVAADGADAALVPLSR